MTTLLKNWHFMRLLRAGIAIWVFAEAWRTGAWLLLIPGSFFALQAIFDLGCCGAAGCAVPQQKTSSSTGLPPADKVVYEELH